MIRPILSLSISCLLIATFAWCAPPEDKPSDTQVATKTATEESPATDVPAGVGDSVGAPPIAGEEPVPGPASTFPPVSAPPITPARDASPDPVAPPIFDPTASPSAGTAPSTSKPPVATNPPAADVTTTTADKDTAIGEIMRLRQRFGSPIEGTILANDKATDAEFGQALEAVASTTEQARTPHHCPLCPHPTAQPQVGPYTAPAGWRAAPGEVVAATAPHDCPLCPAPTAQPQVGAFTAPANWTALAPNASPVAPTSTCMKTHNPVQIIRDAARQLDLSAAALEDVQDYKRADALRESAQRLRLQARQMVHLQAQAQTQPQAPPRY